LEGFYRIQFEPFIFLNPLEWPYIWRYRSTVRKLRAIGREVILKRIGAVQHGDHVPDDLLTHLLRTHGMLFMVHCVICVGAFRKGSMSIAHVFSCIVTQKKMKTKKTFAT
jgi:hypothetical protein